MQNMHCGFVAIVGRPSSGKSTFLNKVVGEHVSITSKMPQTTLNAIRGILTRKDGQIIFLDTPGYNNSTTSYNKKLQNIVLQSLNDSDVVLYIIDSTRPFGAEEESIISLLRTVKKPIFVAFNKLDSKYSNVALSLISLERLLPLSSKQESKNPHNIQIFKISAKRGDGLSELQDAIIKSLPIGHLLYPSEFYTDQEVFFRIEEVIRCHIIENTRDEVPHSVYIKIERAKMSTSSKSLNVDASVFVNKESQKGILIGQNARIIKKIRTASEKDLSEIFPYYIYLNLKVKVDKNWKKRVKT